VLRRVETGVGVDRKCVREIAKNVGRFHPFYRATKTLRESRGIAPLCF
jgi:hypothetical protein